MQEKIAMTNLVQCKFIALIVNIIYLLEIYLLEILYILCKVTLSIEIIL